MSFRWHYALWLLLVLPALVGTYVAALRRRRAQLSREPGVVRAALPRNASALRPYLAPLLFLVGLTALLLSVARPVVVMSSPSAQGTIVLLMDVSLSMAATDVEPSRLAAAQAAAIRFVQAQPPDVRIGVVAFGGHADVVQLPTTSRGEVIAALERLELQRFTAIGNGLIGALLTLFPMLEIGGEYDIFGSGSTPRKHEPHANRRNQRKGSPSSDTVAPGSHLSTAIILVSDGLGTMGIPATKAAAIAADLGVRVYTVGVGTLYGGIANVEGWPPIHADFDEETLKSVADITRGDYFLARNAVRLTSVYEKLGRGIVFEQREHEITALLTAIGIVLTIASTALSLLWSGRPA
jgi:Ca-activated chloride channel family protein